MGFKTYRGFRSFHCFNLTMLAKHGWHFIVDLDALISQFFKVKYFPNGDFLIADMGSNLSCIWRGIYCSPVVLRKGLRWKIGDGSSVNVWNDS